MEGVSDDSCGVVCSVGVADEGVADGTIEMDGCAEGFTVGTRDGIGVGAPDGTVVGTDVGTDEGV